MAVEDIGLADPRALQMAIEAWDTYDRLGSPEGELALAQVAIYLATHREIERRLRRPSARRARDVARIRHAGRAAAPAQRADEADEGARLRQAATSTTTTSKAASRWTRPAFPDAMGERVYYEPVERGLEIKLKEKLDALRAARAKARGELLSRAACAGRRSGLSLQVSSWGGDCTCAF